MSGKWYHGRYDEPPGAVLSPPAPEAATTLARATNDRCAQGDSNSHPAYTGQGPQPCPEECLCVQTAPECAATSSRQDTKDRTDRASGTTVVPPLAASHEQHQTPSRPLSNIGRSPYSAEGARATRTAGNARPAVEPRSAGTGLRSLPTRPGGAGNAGEGLADVLARALFRRPHPPASSRGPNTTRERKPDDG